MSRSINHKPLGDIANIRAGYTFREKINEVADGNIHIVQIKDARKIVEATGTTTLSIQLLPTIHWQGSDKLLIDTNCVILPIRGEYTQASYIEIESTTKPIIVSSQFLILTPKNNSVRCEFLCWALNQSSAQNHFKQESRGTKMSMLSIGSVGALKIPVPSIEIQNRILKLHQLWQAEQTLVKKLLINRETFLAGMFQQLLSSNE